MPRPAPSLCCAAALSLGALALPARAAQLELQVGSSYMDRYPAEAVFVEGVFGRHRLGNSGFSGSADLSLGWIDGRHVTRYDHGRYSTRDPLWLLTGGARFHYGDAGDWYRQLFFSFQLGVQTARTQALSSPFEFVSTLGWQGRHFSAQIRHVSNAGLHNPNRGETMALLGVGFDL
jgi:hypothetical protein